jgi:4-amino-4-deoxy-L-arabinose transferase-like glycosyltransferase
LRSGPGEPRAEASRRLIPLVALLYLAAALHGVGAADIVGDDEAREAGIVQDVVAGHWLWPRFNGELLPDKPILYHWLAAVPCRAAGFSETTVRLPSALAGAAVVGLTGVLGAAILGARAGLIAAGLVATTPGFFDHARVARPDVLLVLLLTAALGLAFRWWRDGGRHDATAALALLGAATLAKGPVAPALFVAALGGFLAWQGDIARLPRIATAPGLAAFLLLGFGWYAIALAGWGDVFVRQHLVGRYLRNLAGGLASGEAYSPKPLVYHLLFYPKHLPAIVLPWTPVVAVALWQAWRTGGFRDPRLRFLLCWAAAPVLVFTPAEWKLRYYLLPSVPALALIAAPTVGRLLGEPPRRMAPRGIMLLAAGVAAALALAIAAAATGLVGLSRSDRSTLAALAAVAPGGAAGAAAIAGFLAGVALVAVAWRAWAVLAGVTAALIALWMVVGVPALEQSVSRRDSLKAFALGVAARRPPPEPLAFWAEPVRPVAVYLGRQVPTVRRPEDVGPGLAVIATEAGFRSLTHAGVIGFPLLAGEGRIGNVARGRIVLLDVAPPPPGGPPPPSSGIRAPDAGDYRGSHGPSGARRDAVRGRARGERGRRGSE